MTFQTVNIKQNNRDKNNQFDKNKELWRIWLGRRDSNPRMPGPKPGALPLGDVLLTTNEF